MEIINLIISLVSGAVGGNLAGAALSEKNLGTIGNTIAGLIGGGAGQYILQALGIISGAGVTSAGVDLTSLLASIGASGVSGGALTAIIGLIKGALQK